MKSTSRLLMCILAGLLVVTVARAESPTVVIVKSPGEHQIFRRISVTESQGGFIVSGRIRVSDYLRRRWGHVDLAVYGPGGNLIQEKPVNYSPSHLTRRVQRKGGARFAADFTGKLEPGSVVKVAFHAIPPAPAIEPLHGATVAR